MANPHSLPGTGTGRAPVAVHYDAVVLNDLTTDGWDGGDGLDDLPKCATTRMEDALATRYDTDAMFQPLAVPGYVGKTLVRLNKGGCAALRDEDDNEPVLTWVVVDLDRPGHAHWDDPDQAKAALGHVHTRLTLAADAPPWAYTTRAGLRAMWRLAEPVPVSRAQSWLSQFHLHIAPALEGVDLELDRSCTEWWRVYRLPFVTRGGQAMDAEILMGETLRWQPSDTDESDLPQPGLGHADRGDAPETRKLTSQEWAHIPEYWRPRLRKGEPLYEAHGDPGHDQGVMCELLPRLCKAVACVEVPDPELLFQAVMPSIEAQGWPPPAKVWARLCDLARNDTETYAFERAMNEGPLKRAYEQGNLDLVDSIREAVAPVSNRREVEREARQATDQGQPMMVYNGASRHAFVRYADGIYRPKAKDVLAPLLERMHGKSLRNARGAFLGFTDLFALVGADCHEVRMRYWHPDAPDERYDANSRVLWKNTPAPDWLPEPKYDPEVARWLELLPEDPAMHPRLLDWLQSAVDPTKPIAALVLCGPKEVGKSMLAAGIGAGWKHVGDYNKTVSGLYNDSLGLSPVLLAEEGLRVDRNDAVEGFKALITTRVHALKIKWLADTYVEGCVRVVIAANKPDDVQLSGDLTPESLAALEERILFVPCSVRAARYLRTVDTHADGGWAPEHGPGRLFNHAAWLAANRELSQPPGRLVVYGEADGRWRKQRLASAGGLDGSALVAMAQIAHSGRGRAGLGTHPKHPGYMLVNANVLHQLWVELTRDNRAPVLRSLSKALATLAEGSQVQATVNGLRASHYRIPVDMILQTADACGIGDVDKMREWLGGVEAPAPVAAQGPQG